MRALLLLALVACSGNNLPGKRRSYAADLNSNLVIGRIDVEGSNNEGLVIDIKGCNTLALAKVVEGSKLLERLDDLKFQWMRCANTGFKITPPWE